MIQTINDGWVHLRNTLIPPDAPEIQLESMEFSFYSGAFTMFALIDNAMSETGPPEEMSKKFAKIMEEINDWREMAPLKYVTDKDNKPGH